MRPSKKSECLEGLRLRILQLDLAPGSELDETQIARSYGLSRTPLREVFQMLAGEGYVKLQQNRGAKVASMDFDTLRGFFQLAPMVYTATARLAAENRPGPQIEVLKQVQARFAAATDAGDESEAALQDHSFHAQIGEMACNPYILPSLRRMLIDQTRLSLSFYTPAKKKDKKQIRKAVQQHDALIEAIEARSPETAVSVVLQHWDLSRDHMERFVRPTPLPLDVAATPA